MDALAGRASDRGLPPAEAAGSDADLIVGRVLWPLCRWGVVCAVCAPGLSRGNIQISCGYGVGEAGSATGGVRRVQCTLQGTDHIEHRANSRPKHTTVRIR